VNGGAGERERLTNKTLSCRGYGMKTHVYNKFLVSNRPSMVLDEHWSKADKKLVNQ
jgi:hypothetical protein